MKVPLLAISFIYINPTLMNYSTINNIKSILRILVFQKELKGKVMKLFFSLLLVSTNALSSMIFIGHNNQESNAIRIKDYFISEYHIPKELILIKRSECLEEVDRRYLQLCVNEKGELIQLSSNIDFQIKSLLTFKQPN
jgi:hypothetical protein